MNPAKNEKMGDIYNTYYGTKAFNKLGTLRSALLLKYNHTIKSRKSQINSLSTKLSINSWAPLGRRRFFRKMRQISELIEVAVSFFTLIGN